VNMNEFVRIHRIDKVKLPSKEHFDQAWEAWSGWEKLEKTVFINDERQGSSHLTRDEVWAELLSAYWENTDESAKWVDDVLASLYIRLDRSFHN
jgi:hypothetical protein